MKKIIISCFLCLMFSAIFAQDFSKYFEDKTLRINYLHIGKHDSESIEIHSFHAGDGWSGTRSHLLDPHRYGDMVFEAFDATTNTPIFSRSYSTLFCEYRATDRALTEIGRFEECVQMPFPKNPIRFSFTFFDRRNKGTLLYTGTFNPSQADIEPFVSQYEIMNLHQGGAPNNCMDILFLPDGYSQADAQKLEEDMNRFAAYVLGCSPFKENKSKINIRAIKGYSAESGITDPRRNIQKNTLLNSSYNVLDLDRYLMCLNIWKMYEIADDAPFDVIVMIANSDKYGGGGIYNFYATVCNGAPQANYVIVHEMGHLIGGLGDEYYSSEVSVRDYYPADIEPAEPNITTLVNFDAKWKKQITTDVPIPTPATNTYKNILGVYEGAGYVAKGVYRPWIDCTMKNIIYNNFCPVCSRVLTEAIDYYANNK